MEQEFIFFPIFKNSSKFSQGLQSNQVPNMLMTSPTARELEEKAPHRVQNCLTQTQGEGELDELDVPSNSFFRACGI